jgi:hypothetical protein
MATRPAKATGTRNPRSPQRAREPAKSARPPAKAARGPAKAATPPTESTQEPAEGAQPPAAPPRALRLAAAALAVEAAGMCVAAVFAAVSTAKGQSYEVVSGIALTLIAVGVAAAFAIFAVGLVRAKPWTRTPVVMVQLFVIIAGITLLDGHRPEWGVPALVLAACCLAGLFTPASLRALNRPPRSQPEVTPPSSGPRGAG